MESTLVVLALWLVFAATHMIGASVRLRPLLVARLGEVGFASCFSLVALLVFVPLCWFYFTHRHEGPLLWTLSTGPAFLWTTYVLQGVAWTLVVAGLAQPSPAMTGADPVVLGAHRITRHPLFMGVGLFGLLHLPSNGFASDVAFFGGLPVFALLGCWHQDRRKLATGGEGYRRWHEQTPFLPFAGAGSAPALLRLPAWVLAGGVMLTVGLRWLHTPLFR